MGNIMSNISNIPEEDYRHIYYVFRAMHDGVCASCGHSSPAPVFKVADSLVCPKCDFNITPTEIQAIEEVIAPKTLERRLEAFKRHRSNLKV